jgi:3-dehydroquinate synthase
MLNRVLTIKSRDFNYDVNFHDDEEHLLRDLLEIQDSAFVVDATISDLYQHLLGQISVHRPVLILEATEKLKSLDGVSKVVEWLLENGLNRSLTLVGVGGGIIQDVVTFTSAIYYRGVKFVLVPTTLLSMADSSIGAKCGINFGSFKNQLGLVNPPRAVHISHAFLATLQDREIMSGYGEILKLAITGGKAHLKKLFDVVDSVGLRGGVSELIYQSLLVKRHIIEEDEYEADLRRILNYGHTFGHALEALTDHQIPHGLAVAWGIDLVNFLSTQQQKFDNDSRLEIQHFISQHLPFKLNQFPSAAELIQHARRDKKMVGQVLNLILPDSVGHLEIVPTQLDYKLELVLQDYLAKENVYSTSQ